MTVSEQFNTPKKIQKKLGYELLSELGRPKHQFSKERAFALIKAGADLRVREAILDRNNALQIAASKGHSECVELLIRHGAEINVANRNNNSSLALAVMYHHDECVRLLIDAGADPDVQNKNGYTALMHCAGTIYGKAEYIPSLLEAGADMDLKNHAGETAMDIARANRSAAKNAVYYLETGAAHRAALAAEEEKRAHEQFLHDTNFHKGLAKPLRAMKPLGFK